jgi:valyl-tRNA synthetase
LDFIWYQYCDWYVEATKVPTPTRASVLCYVANASMRLLHPIAPFITEEIWQALPHDGRTIVTAMWPDPEEIALDPLGAKRYDLLRDVVGKARDLRAQLGLPPREKLTIDISPALDEDARTLLALHAHAVLVESSALGAGVADPLLASAPRAPVQFLRDRYAKDVVRLDAEIARLEKKLGNEQFTSKASAAVVEGERAKMADYTAERARVLEAAARLESGVS